MKGSIYSIIIKQAWTISIICVIFLVLCISCNHNSKKVDRPNVLFIAVDDMKPLLNCYGFDHVKTPNIDKLAEEGIIFTKAYCQQAVCGPSRTSLLTGYFPDRTGIYGMGSEKYKIRRKYPDMLTLPLHFKNNGYTTIGTGKIFDPRNVEGDWNGPQDSVSWTKFYGRNPFYNDETGSPRGHYHNPETHKLMDKFSEEGKARGLSGKELRLYMRDRGAGPAVECYDVPDDAYQDGCIAERGMQQLEALKDSKKPFFLAVGFLKPHLPFVAPKKYWDLYERESLEIPSFQEYPDGAPKCAETSYVEARTYSGVPNEGPIPVETQKELIHGYLACVSYVDAQVGKLIEKLKETGLYENTVIVLWGDHGFHLGDKQIWGKHTTYEQATRVPLIFSNTGYKKGETNNSPVNFLDIFPTLCELTGLETPIDLDGKSLVPIFNGSEDNVNEYAASVYSHDGYWGFAIRTDRYRYVTWYKGNQDDNWQGVRVANEASYTELYDYEKDPEERKNLSGNPAYSKIEEKLQALNREHVIYTQSNQFQIWN